MNRDEIIRRVRQELAETLEIDADDIALGASLFDDLGAESIDLLDLTFRVERAFHIEIPEGEMFQGHLGLQEGGYIENHHVTPAGMQRIREAMPGFDFSRFGDAPLHVSQLPRLLTPATLVAYLERRLCGGAPR